MTEKDLADYQFNYPKIKELEEENNKLLDVINNQDVKIADLEKENERLTVSYETLKLHDEEEIGMLKSENAGQKERLELLNLNANIAVKDLNGLLIKAIELLKEAQGYIENEDDELYDEIEQFLKEIEK